MAEEKQFPASARKLLKAREEGRVLRSLLVVQLVKMIVVFCVLWAAWPFVWVGFEMLLECTVANLAGDPLVAAVRALSCAVICTAVLLTALLVAAVGGEVAQVGFTFAGAASLKNRGVGGAALSRISAEFCRSWQPVLRFCLAGFVLVLVVKQAIWFGAAWLVSPNAAWQQLGVTQLTFWIAILLAVFAVGAVFDYWCKRREHFSELSMSLDEVRREQRETEGDPHVKANRAHLHLSLSLEELKRRVRRSRAIVVSRAAPEQI